MNLLIQTLTGNDYTVFPVIHPQRIVKTLEPDLDQASRANFLFKEVNGQLKCHHKARKEGALQES